MPEIGDAHREMIGAAIHAIGQGQSTIMHALTALAMNGGDELFPGLRADIDKFTEWLQTHHQMVSEIEELVPRTIVVLPPLNIDVM